MTKQNSCLMLAEFLGGNQQILREIPEETARFFKAIQLFNRHFIATDGVIPTPMQPKYEWPLMLASEIFLNPGNIADAVSNVLPRLSVSRIRIFCGIQEWDPQLESVMEFTHKHQGCIDRSLSKTPLPGVLAWWEKSFLEAGDKQCFGFSSEEKTANSQIMRIQQQARERFNH